ncbi:unnamed protein product, partial [Discosporangium mesarthrocarpum]
DQPHSRQSVVGGALGLGGVAEGRGTVAGETNEAVEAQLWGWFGSDFGPTDHHAVAAAAAAASYTPDGYAPGANPSLAPEPPQMALAEVGQRSPPAPAGGATFGAYHHSLRRGQVSPEALGAAGVTVSSVALVERLARVSVGRGALDCCQLRNQKIASTIRAALPRSF